jgi:hypothetical protein
MKHLFLCAVLLLLYSTSAKAQFLLSYDQIDMSAAPGQTVTFSGTLTNQGSSEVFLNGDSYTFSYNDLTLDDTPFFTYAPLSLQAGQSWHGSLFNIGVSPTASSGDYMGDFAIIGGADGSAQDELNRQSFIVSVLPSSQTPEPNVAVTLCTGLLAFGGMFLRKRRFN